MVTGKRSSRKARISGVTSCCDDDPRWRHRRGVAVGPGEGGAQAQFDTVDESLRDALERTNRRFTDEIAQARNAFTGAVVGTVLLAGLMAVGSVVGIWQRLREYR